jgi:hypothetical protein
MDKAQKIQELHELLNELFTPSVPKKLDDIKKGGFRK